MRKTLILFCVVLFIPALSWASGSKDSSSGATIEAPKADKEEKELLELVENGDANGIEQLLKVDIDLNQTDGSGRTALHTAAEKGDEQIVQILLIRGAAVDPVDDLGNTPLHLALEGGNGKTVSVLAEAGADLAIKNSSGLSPATLALSHSSSELPYLLTDENIDKPVIDGIPILHEAARAGLSEHVRVILSDGADISNLDRNGLTALDSALSGPVGLAQARCAGILINEGSPRPQDEAWYYIYEPIRSSDLEKHFDYGSTALHLAAEYGHEGMLRYLLESGADLDARDQPGNTALHVAVRKGYRTIATILLDRGTDVDVKDFNGNAPLHDSLTANDNLAMTRLLLDRGADPNIKNGYGSTPLHLTVLLGADVSAARLLVERGALIDPRDRTGNTPLLLAVEYTDRDLAELFLAQGADIFALNNDGLSPAEGALSYGPEVSTWFFVGRRLSETDNEGRSVLHLAVSMGTAPETLEVLLKAGAFPDLRDFNGETSLHYAVEAGSSIQGLALMDHSADPFLENNSGLTPLVGAFNQGPEFTIAFLTGRLNIEDRWGGTPLFHAVQWDFPLIVEAILLSDADVMHRNHQGATVLHEAVHGESMEISSLLLDSGADPNATDNMNRTPLHDAVTWGSYEMTRFLVEYGADTDLKDSDGSTALHMSAFSGNDDITGWLLDRGASPDIRDNSGQTALFIAAESDRRATITLLLNAGAGLSIRDKQGRTPLHASVNAGRADTAVFLIAEGSDFFAMDAQGVTPFDLAMEGGSALLDALLNESLANRQDNRGYTPLHMAVESGAAESIIRTILQNGADRKMRNAMGLTPGELAVELGDESVAALLL